LLLSPRSEKRLLSLIDDFINPRLRDLVVIGKNTDHSSVGDYQRLPQPCIRRNNFDVENIILSQTCCLREGPSNISVMNRRSKSVECEIKFFLPTSLAISLIEALDHDVLSFPCRF